MIYAWIFFALNLLALRIWGADALRHGLPEPFGALAVDTLGITLAVVVALVVDRLVAIIYWNGIFRRRKGHKAPALVRDLVTFTLLVIGLSVGLYAEVGVAASGLAAASGAAAVVLGFALQTMILDLFSGLSINLDRSYVIGDWLTIHSQELGGEAYGRVDGISWRTTFLHLEDGRRLIVPNRLITANPVTNHSRPSGAKRLAVRVNIDIRAASERVLGVLLGEAFKAVRMAGLAQTPAPEVLVAGVEGDVVTYEIRFHAFPDRVEPSVARSIMLRALQDAVRLTALPTPVEQIEFMPTPQASSAATTMAEIRDAIAAVPLFAEALSSEQVDDLAARCAPARLPAGRNLIVRGDVGASMFVILEGAAAVVIAGPDGLDQEVNVLATGDIVGEMSLLTGTPRNATVRALTALRVLEIRKEAIEALLDLSPELLERFSRVLAIRQSQLDEVSSRTVKTRSTETDLLAKMRAFFFRAFRGEDAADA